MQTRKWMITNIKNLNTDSFDTIRKVFSLMDGSLYSLFQLRQILSLIQIMMIDWDKELEDGEYYKYNTCFEMVRRYIKDFKRPNYNDPISHISFDSRLGQSYVEDALNKISNYIGSDIKFVGVSVNKKYVDEMKSGYFYFIAAVNKNIDDLSVKLSYPKYFAEYKTDGNYARYISIYNGINKDAMRLISRYIYRNCICNNLMDIRSQNTTFVNNIRKNIDNLTIYEKSSNRKSNQYGFTFSSYMNYFIINHSTELAFIGAYIISWMYNNFESRIVTAIGYKDYNIRWGSPGYFIQSNHRILVLNLLDSKYPLMEGFIKNIIKEYKNNNIDKSSPIYQYATYLNHEFNELSAYTRDLKSVINLRYYKMIYASMFSLFLSGTLFCNFGNHNKYIDDPSDRHGMLNYLTINPLLADKSIYTKYDYGSGDSLQCTVYISTYDFYRFFREFCNNDKIVSKIKKLLGEKLFNNMNRNISKALDNLNSILNHDLDSNEYVNYTKIFNNFYGSTSNYFNILYQVNNETCFTENRPSYSTNVIRKRFHKMNSLRVIYNANNYGVEFIDEKYLFDKYHNYKLKNIRERLKREEKEKIKREKEEERRRKEEREKEEEKRRLIEKQEKIEGIYVQYVPDPWEAFNNVFSSQTAGKMRTYTTAYDLYNCSLSNHFVVRSDGMYLRTYIPSFTDYKKYFNYIAYESQQLFLDILDNILKVDSNKGTIQVESIEDMNFNDFEQLCKNNRILEFTTNKFYYRYDESTRNPNRYDEILLSRDTTFYIINANIFNDSCMSNNEKVNMLTCIRSMGLLRSTGFDRRYSPRLPLKDTKGFEPNTSPYPITFVEKDINTYFINKRYNNENNTMVYPTDTDICGLKNISYKYINEDNTYKTLYANCIIINKEYFWYNLARLLSSNVNVRYVRFYLLSFVQYLKTKNPDIYINTDKSVKNIEIFKDILEYLGKDKNDWILNNNNLRLVDLKM